LVLLSAVVAVYLPATQGGFVWDDDYNVTANPALRDVAGLGRIWSEVTVPPWYPLYHTVFWAGFQLWGLNALGYHLLNVLLHALNAFLVWRILSRLELRGAWLAAALFALHPVQVESVAWITELKNVLSTTFYLAAMSCYLSFVGLAPSSGRPTHGRRSYGLAVLLFACALLTKTVTATLPVALLLLVWWKRGTVRRSDLLPTLPLVGLGVTLGLVTAWTEKVVVGASGFSWSHGPVERVLVAGRAFWFYAGKLVWPDPILFVYPRWTIDRGQLGAYVYPAAALALMALLWAVRRKIGRGPLAGVAFFVLTLTPALGFFDVFYTRYAFVADRWQYLACCGLFAVAAAGLGSILARSGKAGRVLGVVAAASVLAGLGVSTWSESRHYSDAETLWRATLEENPHAFAAHNNLGGMLLRRGETRSAERHFRDAVHIQPDFPESRNNLGIVLHTSGRFEEASAEYREAIRLHPAYADAYNNLGITLAAQGEFEAAVEQFETAVRLQPQFAKALLNLGTAQAYLGRDADAIARFEEALAVEPEHSAAWALLGDAQARVGRSGEAVEAYREALRLEPGSARVALDLAWILATDPAVHVRNGADAVRLAETVVARPGGEAAMALDVLAAAYAEAGRFEAAVTTAERALEASRQAGAADLEQAIAPRLSLYRNHQAFRTYRSK
jgi:tetratricopeptide (TPR) repeat protein